MARNDRPVNSSSESSSESEGDNAENGDVMQDEAPQMRRQLEQGELSDTGSEEGDAGDVEQIVARLKRTQKELENRVKQLTSQVDEPADSYKWKKEGLKIQYQLGLKVLGKCNAAANAHGRGQPELCIEYVRAVIEIVHRRNKELRIADESEGGWETVSAYRSHSIADNAADDKAIKRADKVGKERLAAKQRKNNRPYRRPFNRSYRPNYRDDRASPDHDFYRSVGSNRSQDSAQRQTYVPERRRPTPQSVCFYCGQQGHWQTNCPAKQGKKD